MQVSRQQQPLILGLCTIRCIWPLLWLDAHDLDGDGAPEGAAEGGLVSGAASIWKDKSGNNNNLSHGIRSSRPTLTVAGKMGEIS